MQFVDTESQSFVGMIVVIEAIATELLTGYLRKIPADQRQVAIDRIEAQVIANGKRIVDMAPKVQLDGAVKIQAAALRLVKAATTDALAEIAKT
jgi:hypothetical protein